LNVNPNRARSRGVKERLALRLKRYIPLCFLLLLLPLLVSGATDASPQETTSEFTIPWKSPAEADGFIKPGEYDDALMVNLTRGDSLAYLYIKLDGEYLYVFLDHVSDTISWFDNCWVAIDTLSDGGDAPSEDDYLFDSTHHIWIGDGPHQGDIPGGQWTELKGHRPEPYSDLVDELEPFLEGRHMGWSGLGRSSNSLSQHMIFEIKIPIKSWELAERRTFRLCVAAGSPAARGSLSLKVVWPDAAYGFYTADFWAGGAILGNPSIDPQVGSFPPPSTWGRATLSDVPPEGAGGGGYWSYIAIVVVVIFGILVIVLLLKKLR